MNTWLAVFFAFQIGYIPNGVMLFYEPSHYEYDLKDSFDARFIIDTKIFNFFKIGGEITSNFSFDNRERKISPINFVPTGITFLVYAGIEPIKGISFIWEHSCSHPVSIYFPDYPGNHCFDSGYDRVYMEIKGEWKP